MLLFVSLKSIPNKNKRLFLCSELVELKNGEKSISDKYKMFFMKSFGLLIPILFKDFSFKDSSFKDSSFKDSSFKDSSFKDVNFFNKGILEISCTVL